MAASFHTQNLYKNVRITHCTYLHNMKNSGTITVLKNVRFGGAMVIAKQMEVRANMKEYFDMAYDGTPVIVPRKNKKNIVIISEAEYHRLTQNMRLSAYADSFRSMQNRGSDSSDESLYPDGKSFNLAKLKVISELQNDWNGNGAGAFSSALIEKVRDLLEHLTIQPQIFPTALSSVQLEYDNSKRDHMEIEIGEYDVAEVFCVTYDGRESFESISVDYKSINERVGAFYG